MVDPREAFIAEWSAVRDWINTIPADALDRPSILEGWTVRDVVAHLGRAVGMLETCAPDKSGDAALTVARYAGSYPTNAEAIAEGTRELARERADDLSVMLDERWQAASDALDQWGPDDKQVIRAHRGPIVRADLVRTRTLELVVHSDDLARSVPEVEPPIHDRQALRDAVKLLLGILVERAPGRTVEVRVPPFAAVQCIDGPSHTRGTPPNTVEADPLTWVRLACGRRAWAAAVADGSARASGLRADLSPFLPLL